MNARALKGDFDAAIREALALLPEAVMGALWFWFDDRDRAYWIGYMTDLITRGIGSEKAVLIGSNETFETARTKYLSKQFGGMPKWTKAREKFDKLRARYYAAKGKRDDHRSSLRGKYGGEYQDSWLLASDRKRSESLQAAVDKAAGAFFANVQAISPRDWSCDVPVYWVVEYLTFEDAVRPVGEPLSVASPLSYGATRPIT